MHKSMARHLTSRREFFKRSALVAGAILATSSLPAATLEKAGKRSAIDLVPLGAKNKGVKICRLGFGTGSKGGSIQRALGQEGFTRLLRYAYDQGITYIDTAQNYKTHEMVREAIKGLPREKLFIQTKMWGVPEKPGDMLDRFRQELNVDYFDSVLCHCATTHNWDEERKRVMDAFLEAQSKGIVKVKGVSCHGLAGLTRATEVDWVDVHLVRVNPQCAYVDGEGSKMNQSGKDITPVMKEVKSMSAKGRGIIGMKIIGNGDFVNAEDREKSIRFAMAQKEVNAVVIGFKSTQEIDEVIERINRALAEV